MVRFIMLDNNNNIIGVTDLHSNMVRFIIGNQSAAGGMTTLYLHSNMVRFIIGFCPSFISSITVFTFQYG